MHITESRALPSVQSPVLVPSLRLWPLLLFIAVVCSLSVFFVWTRLQVTQREYEISALENQIRTLSKQQRVLALELESLENPARIERIARRELGLRIPEAHQVVVVR